MTKRCHTHNCADCNTAIPCDANFVADHDGSEPHCTREWKGAVFLFDDCADRRIEAIRGEARADNDR